MARVRKKDFNYFSSKKYDGMMGRCYRVTDASYKHYGDRGIRVSSEWIKDISVFRAWLLQQLSILNVSVETFTSNPKNYQLDRIDTDGHYTAVNCRIVSSQSNSRNRRVGVLNKAPITSAEGEKISF